MMEDVDTKPNGSKRKATRPSYAEAESSEDDVPLVRTKASVLVERLLTLG